MPLKKNSPLIRFKFWLRISLTTLNRVLCIYVTVLCIFVVLCITLHPPSSASTHFEVVEQSPFLSLFFCKHCQLNSHWIYRYAKNPLNWMRVKYLRWFTVNKEIMVALGNNPSIISATLKPRYSVLVRLVGQQVNEANGINTRGVVEDPQGRELGRCIIRALLAPRQYTQCLNKGQIVLCLYSHPGRHYFRPVQIFFF